MARRALQELAAKALVCMIIEAGGKATAVQADIADAIAVGQLFDKAEAAFGGTDILDNTAVPCIWRRSLRATTLCLTG
ncbi:Rossmann-fold NAD(P)-binding domain-containing protein [Teichococcus vastitatis]|jgi:NAD(P)-dependent dehydrogenase (short-subunit alcohol dehydrogenase family)|uniref:Uncharacterized protein n=1 Tax=Teichococcus vastitatis TaxID=2307076 RepID=A0ABS9WA75_9PROT|nr:hypothetical protein [Pseudoroseomonas vastitatis]MCI0756118.1 hypothetical protein [Pseudoroseomonas vastitatis]